MGVQNFPFLRTWPKKRIPQKHYKIGFQQSIFRKTVVRHETAIFGPKKPNSEIPVIIFWPIFLFQQRKTYKFAETAILKVF